VQRELGLQVQSDAKEQGRDGAPLWELQAASHEREKQGGKDCVRATEEEESRASRKRAAVELRPWVSVGKTPWEGERTAGRGDRAQDFIQCLSG
jgi:hypothetical protein